MNPILVALDVDSTAHALAAAHTVRGHVGGLKIGKQLFTSEGPTGRLSGNGAISDIGFSHIVVQQPRGAQKGKGFLLPGQDK